MTMSSNNDRNNTSKSERVVVATQHYASTVEKTFLAWTDPSLLQRWFGPPGTQATVLQHELNIGGKWKIRMDDGHGNEYHHFGSFLEITEPERLVFTWASEEQIDGWRDVDGNPTVVTVEIKKSGNGVDVCVTHENLISDQAFQALTHGWNGSLNRLVSVL